MSLNTTSHQLGGGEYLQIVHTVGDLCLEFVEMKKLLQLIFFSLNYFSSFNCWGNPIPLLNFLICEVFYSMSTKENQFVPHLHLGILCLHPYQGAILWCLSLARLWTL